jgi:hypothetical protein
MKLPFLISCALILPLSSALAVEKATPLPAGKPAGVKKAQLLDDKNAMFVVAGAALVGIGIGLAVSSDDNNAPPASTTTSATGTSP